MVSASLALKGVCCIAAKRYEKERTSAASVHDSCVVIIPALNEEATIWKVIIDLHRRGFRRVVAVDNGSSDRTACRARLAGAAVVREPRRGYGRACWTAIKRLPPEIDWILFCDADGSSDLRDLEPLVLATRSADLVLGNRTANAANRRAMTAAQRFGNALATALIRWGWGYEFADLGPLRLIRRESLDRIRMRDRGFGWTVEMQIRAVEIGLRIREVPVRYRPRQGGTSKISGTVKGTLRAGVVIIATVGRLFLLKITRRLQRIPSRGSAPARSWETA